MDFSWGYIFSNRKLAERARGSDYASGSGLVFPIDNSAFLHEVHLDAQQALVARMPRARHGLFKDSFREIYSIARDFQDLKIEDAERIVAGERSRSGEVFETMGLKVPAEDATEWGALLIMSIQVYLWVHLHELSGRLQLGDEGWTVAWVGVYHSRPSRIVLWLSLAVLPVVAVLALGIRNLGSTHGLWLSWSAYGCSLVISICLSLATLRAFPRRRRDGLDGCIWLDRRT